MNRQSHIGAALLAYAPVGAIQRFPPDVVEPVNFGASVTLRRDTEGLSEVLSSVMGDPELRRGLAERSREWVETVFGGWGWQEKAETVIELVEDG